MKYAPLSWIQIGRVMTPSANKIRIVLNKIPVNHESCSAQVYIGSTTSPAEDIRGYLNSKMAFSNRQRECLEIIASSSPYSSAKGNFALNAQKLSHIFSLCGNISIEVKELGRIVPNAHPAEIRAKMGETEDATPGMIFDIIDPTGDPIEDPVVIGTTEARIIDDKANLFALNPPLLPSEARTLLETSPLPIAGLTEDEARDTLHALAQLGINLTCLREASKPSEKEPQVILRTIVKEGAPGQMELRMHLVTELTWSGETEEVEVVAKGDLVPVYPITQNLGRSDEMVICVDRPTDRELIARKYVLDLGARPANAHRGFSASGDKAFFVLEQLDAGGAPEWLKIEKDDFPETVSLQDKPTLIISEREGLMNLSGRIDLGESADNLEIDFEQLTHTADAGNLSFYHDSHAIIQYSDKLVEAIRHLHNILGLTNNHTEITLNFAELAVLATMLKDCIELECPPHLKEQIDILANSDTETDQKLPASLLANLRPYQKEAVAWMSNLDRIGLGRLLADDMGLGKTLMILTLMAKVKETRQAHLPTLIVAPTSVIDVWIQEADKHFTDLTTYKWHGADRHDDIDAAKKSDLVITSFALLRRDQDTLSKEFRFRYLIVDEAQHVKNAKTESWKAANRVYAEQKIAISGTPIENRLEDLWSIFQLIVPGILKNESGFQKRYVQPINKGDKDRLKELKNRIKPLMLRRRKHDVEKDLPPKIENILRCHMTDVQSDLYNRVLASSFSQIKNILAGADDNKARMPLLAALTKLRQVCCDPALISGDTSPKDSAKIKLLGGVIDECREMGRKMIIYSQFVEMQHLIHDLLKERGIHNALWLHGGTRNRGDVVKQFQDPKGPPVIVVSLKAGGTGVTLTEADTVIHYDPWWNPAVEDQATDRAHRIGQKKTVHVIKLICENSIEDQMLAMCSRKRKAANSILDSDEGGIKTLTMDEIKSIFEKELKREGLEK